MSGETHPTCTPGTPGTPADPDQPATALPAGLLTDVSHELRTPLASIAGYAELLADPVAGLDAGAGRMLQAIRRNAARMARTLDALTALADLDRGDIPRRREPIDIAALLAALPDELAHDLELHRVTLRLGPLPPLPQVPADVNYLQLALVELTLAAVLAAGPDGTLEITAGTAAGEVAIAITGGDGAAAPAVTGLGATAARGIVQRHGGRVELRAGIAVHLPAG